MDGGKGAGPDPTSEGHDTDVVAVGGFPHGEVLDVVWSGGLISDWWPIG